MKTKIFEITAAILSIIIAIIVLYSHRAEWLLIGIYWLVVAARNTITALQGIKND